MSGQHGQIGGPNFPNVPSGNFLRGQGGDNRDSHELPNEGLSQAKFAAEVDGENVQPEPTGLFERLKGWLRARF